MIITENIIKPHLACENAGNLCVLLFCSCCDVYWCCLAGGTVLLELKSSVLKSQTISTPLSFSFNVILLLFYDSFGENGIEGYVEGSERWQ